MLDNYNTMIHEERANLLDGLEHGMLIRVLATVSAIRLSSPSKYLWSQRHPGGEGDGFPCLQPVKPFSGERYRWPQQFLT